MHCHLVFSTKNREHTIHPQWQPRLYEYLGGIIREKKGCLLAAGGMSDHVHLLISFAKETSTSHIVRDIKANSSGWIHETFADSRGFAWQAGYGAFSVSFSNLDAVRRYIAMQEEHHRARSFQEELRELLTRHQIVFDERYIGD
jgi:REP element-mobilizing transposase RayT